MKELYINDILCDLSEKDNPIALTYEVNDIAELKDRQAYRTNNFKIPLTQNNRRACGFPDTGSIIGLQPYRKNTCKIVQDGIEVLPKGIAIINQTSGEISVQCLSGLIGFFDLIDSKSIRDLDMTEFEHDWTLATVVDSQLNDEGFIYPIIEYGSLSETDRIVNVRQLRPATFRHTIIEKIISEAGYTASGVIFSDQRYLRSLHPFSLDKFEHGKSFVDASNTFSASARSQTNQEFSNDDRDGVVVFSDDTATDPGNNWSGTEYIAPDIVSVKVKLNYDLRVRDQYKGGSTPDITIRIQKFVSSWVTVVETTHPAVGEFEDYDYMDQVLETNIDLLAGQKIRVAWHSGPDTNRIYGVWYAGSQIAITYQAAEVVFGQSIQLEATLPKISQKDYFKDFLQNFGLIAIPDNYKKHLLLINMQEVYENKYRALDWTDKFTDRRPEIDYSFGSYGINNYGVYKDDDSVPDGTGDGVLVFDNLTLKQNVDLFTSQFAASISVNRLNGVVIARILKIEDPAKSLNFTLKTEPRILMDDKVNIGITFTDDTTEVLESTVSIPYFQQPGKLGIGYQDYFDNHYPEMLRMLYRPFVQDRWILLKARDLQNLNFTLPIFDRKDSAYYYNNGIKEWISGEECKISLIKMK